MEVELLHAELVPTMPPFTWRGMRMQIAVRNIAYEKRVSVYFSEGSVLDARYQGPLEGDMEEWRVEDLWPEGRGTRTPRYRFAIRYDVAGQTYWDNNNGWDYELTPSNDGISHDHPTRHS